MLQQAQLDHGGLVILSEAAYTAQLTPYTPRRRAPVPCWQHYGGAPWQPRTHANTPRQSGGCGRRTAWAYPWRVGLTITPVDARLVCVQARPVATGIASLQQWRATAQPGNPQRGGPLRGPKHSRLPPTVLPHEKLGADGGCSAARPNAITPVLTRGRCGRGLSSHGQVWLPSINPPGCHSNHQTPPNALTHPHLTRTQPRATARPCQRCRAAPSCSLLLYWTPPTVLV